MSNSLDPDQGRHFVVRDLTDLVPSCLQRFSADGTSRQRVNYKLLTPCSQYCCIWASTRENLSWGFPTKQDSEQSPQLQRLARKLKIGL